MGEKRVIGIMIVIILNIPDTIGSKTPKLKQPAGILNTARVDHYKTCSLHKDCHGKANVQPRHIFLLLRIGHEAGIWLQELERALSPSWKMFQLIYQWALDPFSSIIQIWFVS